MEKKIKKFSTFCLFGILSVDILSVRHFVCSTLCLFDILSVDILSVDILSAHHRDGMCIYFCMMVFSLIYFHTPKMVYILCTGATGMARVRPLRGGGTAPHPALWHVWRVRAQEGAPLPLHRLLHRPHQPQVWLVLFSLMWLNFYFVV